MKNKLSENEIIDLIMQKTKEIEEIIYSLNDEELEVNIMMNILGNIVLRYAIPPELVMSSIIQYQQMTAHRKALSN